MNVLCRNGRRCLGATIGLIVSLWPLGTLASTGASRVDLVLQGTIAPRCAFLDAPQELTIAPGNGPTASSPLSFACNLPDAQAVSLTISSVNGALKRDDGDTGLAYAISWNVDGATPVNSFRPGTEATRFSLEAGPIGSTRSGMLSVALAQPSSIIQAGTYSDQITFSLCP